MRETSRHLSRAIVTALGVAILAAAFSACGGESAGQFANETPGEYPVEVVGAEFKPLQTVARTYEMNIEVRNTGDETIPALNTTIDLPGRDSTLAFAYRTPQKGVAQPQRPVWVLEEGYPKLAGTEGRGGAGNANRRTFNFGELPPGETADMVWRLTAVTGGTYRLRWQLSAGLGLDTSAVDAAGGQPTGILPVRISSKARLTEIDEKGNVVPLDPAQQRALELQEAN